MFNKKKKIEVNSDELNDALQVQKELVSFYQYGFLDGYMKANNINITRGQGRVKRETAIFKRIEKEARAKFEKRFLKKIVDKTQELMQPNG